MTAETALALALALGSPAPKAAPPKVAPPPAAAVAATKTVITHRAPIGHTHTCANGHTWDHQANPTHTCQFCGKTQYVQDSGARPVTVLSKVQVESKQVAPVAPPVPATITFPQLRMRAVQSGGCANGQCASPYSFR